MSSRLLMLSRMLMLSVSWRLQRSWSLCSKLWKLHARCVAYLMVIVTSSLTTCVDNSLPPSPLGNVQIKTLSFYPPPPPLEKNKVTSLIFLRGAESTTLEASSSSGLRLITSSSPLLSGLRRGSEHWAKSVSWSIWTQSIKRQIWRVWRMFPSKNWLMADFENESSLKRVNCIWFPRDITPLSLWSVQPGLWSCWMERLKSQGQGGISSGLQGNFFLASNDNVCATWSKRRVELSAVGPIVLKEHLVGGLSSVPVAIMISTL